MKAAHAAAGLLLGLAATSAAPSEAMLEPGPIAVPAGTSPALVDKAIRLALACEGWSLRHQGPDEMRIAFTRGHHSAWLRVQRDPAAVRLSYRESYALDYEQSGGKRWVHETYNRWVGALAQRIAAQLSRRDLAEAPDLAFSVAGNALTPVRPNPPPLEALSRFGKYEIAWTALAPHLDSERDQRVQEKLQSVIDRDLGLVFAQWNASPAGPAGRVLRVEPRIVEMARAGGRSRYQVKGLLDRPYMVVAVRFVDVSSGQAVATPVFHAEAMEPKRGMAGFASDGVIEAIGVQLRDYAKLNYASAVGRIGGQPVSDEALCGPGAQPVADATAR